MGMKKKYFVAGVMASSLLLQGFGPLDVLKDTILNDNSPQQQPAQEAQNSNGLGKTAIVCAGMGGLSSLLGKNTKGKILAGVGGTLLCSVIGKFWADKLAEEDQKKLAEKTANTMTTGKNTSFENNSTNVSGTVKVIKEEPHKKKVKKIKVLKDRVEETPPLVADNNFYEVASTANLRGGPGTDFKVVGQMEKGAVTEVIGQVKDSDWFLIAQDDVGLGYMYGPLLHPTSKTILTSQAVTGDVEKVKVETQTNCRTIQQEVNIPEQGTVTQDFKACQKSNGEWEIV